MSRSRPYTNPEIRRIAEQWRSGASITLIACDHNRTATGIKMLAQHNRDLFPPRPGGAPRRINYERAAKMQAEGFSFSEIARRFGVTDVAVRYALNASVRRNRPRQSNRGAAM